MEGTGVAPGMFARSLYESHGYAALLDDQAAGRAAAIDRYPCSLRLIDDAAGVVVHSAHAIDVARAAFRIAPENWRTIPQLRRLPDLAGRDAARRALGLGPGDLLFASFGFLDATKLDHRIVDAWLASPLAADPRCSLVFVGENHGGEYGRDLAARIAAARGRVRITGYVDAAAFERHLLAADVAIQLRGVSRGETSRSALDCLAHALPLVANASGSLAELPAGVVLRLPAEFGDDELAAALARLASDQAMRTRLGTSARRHIAQWHDPARVAGALRDAVEGFAAHGPQRRHRQLVSAAVRAGAEAGTARDDDWRAAAQAIAANRRRSRTRQLFVDVTVLAKQDLRSGIERVARAVLRELLERPRAGCLVEPVVAAPGCYAYARAFTARWLGLPPLPLPDAPIDVAPGDVFFGLDWAADVVPGQEAALARYRTLGVRMAFLIHDLLPVRAPQFYPPGIDAMHETWLQAVARLADGVFCVSNAVADDFAAWLDEEGCERASPIAIDVLPPAADVERSVPSKGMPDGADALLEKIGARAALLMVGTVEPRKGHAQALAACEMLWRAGDDVGLVLVGRQGWLVDDLAERLRRHPEAGRRLFWFEDASDEWLDAVYARASVLLAPSHGEGFGLPLIEAARRGTPLLVRDLPVFREVAGEHATYFAGNAAADLAAAIRDWQDAKARGALPDSSRIAPRRWRDSVEHAAHVMLDDAWSREWRSGDAAPSGAARRTRFAVDFSRTSLSPGVQAVAGLSAPEQWGRWSDANLRRSVEIRFRAPVPARGTLTLTARAFGPNAGQPVRLRIGGHEAELRFGVQETTASEVYAVDAPSQVLEIVPPHPARPCDLDASRDDRRLGIGLVRLTIEPA
jgi:glycosyltransferase involved in cell wall biosynthesis